MSTSPQKTFMHSWLSRVQKQMHIFLVLLKLIGSGIPENLGFFPYAKSQENCTWAHLTVNAKVFSLKVLWWALSNVGFIPFSSFPKDQVFFFEFGQTKWISIRQNMACFIYILDSSNSSSTTFWTDQFGSSSRSKWTIIWTGSWTGSWTDNNHIISVKRKRWV